MFRESHKDGVDILPVSVFCMRASRELDFLVGAVERDVEPCKESVDVFFEAKQGYNVGPVRA